MEIIKNNVVLLKGNCLELMKDIPNESIDLIVTDCPYHIVSGGCTNVKRDDEPSGIFNRRNAFTQKKMLKVGNYLIIMILNLKNGCQIYSEY